MKNYYDLLGLKQDCLPDDIKKAYKKLAIKFHPDKNEGDEYFAEMFKQINEANEVLSNPIKRKEYDRLINSSTNEHFNTKSETSDSNTDASEKTKSQTREKLIILIKRTDNYWLKKEEEKNREEEYNYAKGLQKPNHLNAVNILGSIVIVLIAAVIYVKTPSEEPKIEKPIIEEVETSKINNSIQPKINQERNKVNHNSNIKESVIDETPLINEEKISQTTNQETSIIEETKTLQTKQPDSVLNYDTITKKKKKGFFKRLFGSKESNYKPPQKSTKRNTE